LPFSGHTENIRKTRSRAQPSVQALLRTTGQKFGTKKPSLVHRPRGNPLDTSVGEVTSDPPKSQRATRPCVGGPRTVQCHRGNGKTA